MAKEFNPQEIKIIVGLGNPGREYTHTYHNVGTEAALYLRKKSFSQSEVFVIYEESPSIYMNESGSAVKQLLKKSKCNLRDMLVLHDDSDLPLGSSRYSFGRSAAGHKGVESIIQSLGTKKFWRFRIGIRKEAADVPRRVKAGEFVLKKITRADTGVLEEVFKKLFENLTGGTGTSD